MDTQFAGVSVAGEASADADAIAQAETLRPDVALMDNQMPDMNGIEATRRIPSNLPGIHVIRLTMLEDDGSLFPAMRTEERGYMWWRGAESDRPGIEQPGHCQPATGKQQNGQQPLIKYIQQAADH